MARSQTEHENPYLILTGFALLFTGIAGWFTHVITIISVLTSGSIPGWGYGLLLLVGAVCPPVGAIHGVGIWFGAW